MMLDADTWKMDFFDSEIMPSKTFYITLRVRHILVSVTTWIWEVMFGNETYQNYLHFEKPPF